MGRAVYGFALAVVIGLAVGIAISRSRIVRAAFGPIITGMQTMPAIAWFPFAIIFFGLTTSAILFVIVIGTAPAIAIAVIAGSDNIPPLLRRAAKMMGLKGFALYRAPDLAGITARRRDRSQTGLGLRVAQSDVGGVGRHCCQHRVHRGSARKRAESVRHACRHRDHDRHPGPRHRHRRVVHRPGQRGSSSTGSRRRRRIVTSESRPFRLWAFGDAHVGTDKAYGRSSLAEAISHSEFGGPEGGPPFEWDIAIDVGDMSGAHHSVPDDTEGEEVVAQLAALRRHRREDIYSVCGNHDRNGLAEPEGWWWQKWVDPLGQHTEFSGVDPGARTYPVDGSWERYSFRAGNLLFLMMSDRNEPSQSDRSRDARRKSRRGGER